MRKFLGDIYSVRQCAVVLILSLTKDSGNFTAKCSSPISEDV